MEKFSDTEVFERLQKLCESALQSPFYAKRIVDIPKNIDDFAKIPFLTRQDVFDNSYPRSTDMLTTDIADMIVSSTGGSSGIARYTLLTHSEWDEFCALQAESMKKIGISKDDTVANLMVAGSMWPSFLGVHEIIKHIGATHLPISANIDINRIMELIVDFKPTALISLPTLFVLLTDIAKQKNIKLDHIKTIAYAGEHMSKEVRKYIGESLGVENIRALAYTSADVGLMGYQCSGCQPNEYHLPKGYQYMEIYDFENERLCNEGEQGEVIITGLVKHAMPIIRYRLGDVACFTGKACSCGDSNPVFTLSGRAGEDFKLGGAYISMNVIEETVGKFSGHKGVSMNHTLTLEDAVNQMDIILAIESSDPAASESCTEAIKDELMARIPEIKVGLEMNFIRNYEITFLQIGALERSPITGKVKRLNDKRVVE
jgi:phenylacetate-CoA ligase